ncbi:MAG: hypothetical protein JWO57_1628, partial [Pseudonocardiales bacterium]|nr:hypothetical protein [Pseudonocardiales bacterium]
MTNLLKDYITAQLRQRVDKYGLVVWYDPRSEFTAFVDELRGSSTAELAEIDVAGSAVRLATYEDSFYALRFAAEPFVAGDDPHPIVLYLPGLTADVHGSVLMELELAGCRWEPKLRQLARNALRQRFTDGAIDDLLGREKVTYQDLVDAVGAGGEGGPPSLLKRLLFGSSSEEQLASWLANPGLDSRIAEKEATGELGRLIAVRLGLNLDGDDLTKWRAITVRHALAVEFRADLSGELPSNLQHLPAATDDAERHARVVARILRDDHA